MKVCLNLLGGWRNSMTFVLTGLDIEEKAALTLRSLEAALGGADQFAEFDARLIRSDKPDAPDQRRGHRPAADHGQGRRRRTGGPALLRRGHRAGPGRLPRAPPHRAARRRARSTASTGRPWCRPTWWSPRWSTPTAAGWTVPHTAYLADRTAHADRRRLAGPGPGARCRVGARRRARPRRRPARRAGPTRRLPLGTIIGARSGDKGGNANVGLWARTDEAWTWLDGYLTIERFRALLPEADDLEVRRYAFPNLRALNFVVVGLLGEGVACPPGPIPRPRAWASTFGAELVDIPVGCSRLTAGRAGHTAGPAEPRGVPPWTSSNPTS